ncbi:cAMP-dependent protein kinase inhibitor alpha [Grus japonensis]|uniref:cAMP-dependent protein kinase inhibitor alpha n=1 Tax=Grus japonensis TaxID=30415 RepID=A0ABC9WE14_GRUJA
MVESQETVKRLCSIRGAKMEIEKWFQNLAPVVDTTENEAPWTLGSILGPTLFNIFISDLDDGIKCTLMKFADDTKLSGEVDTSEGRATLQEDLGRLEEQANKNLIKFNKHKCKVLHLGKYNPELQHRLGSTWLESSSVERDLGVLGDNKLNMSEQCAAAAKKANRVLGCINKGIASRDEEVVIPLSASQATPGTLCSVLVPTIQKRCGQAGEGPEKGHQDDQRTGRPAIGGKAERTGFVQP